MAKYLLSVYQPEGTPPTPEELDAIMKNVAAFEADAKTAGVWVFSGGLDAQSTATVVRKEGDEVLLTDGPFAEAKEYLGGLTIIDAADLDEALHWGRRATEATTLPIEVRPFFWA
nr:YciI family protein [Pseudonocardia pini]